MSYYGGRIAADTLGFITGDIPGAIAADRIYQRYYGKSVKKNLPKKQMAGKKTLNLKRKISMSATPAKRRKSYSSSSSSGASSYKPRKLFKSVQPGNNGQGIRVSAISSKGGGKVSKEGRKKLVKVPKRLRAQVNQILKPSGPSGTFMETFCRKITPVNSGQSVIKLGTQSNGTYVQFDPNYILHAASVLWNSKTPVTNPTFGAGNTFQARAFSTTVIKQTCTSRFKNNTGRTMYISLYCVSPKGKKTDNDDPSDRWNEAMIEEQGQLILEQDNLNVGDADATTLYATPYMSRMFMNEYTVECKKYILEPGKEFVHVLEGPNMKEYALSKFYDPNLGGGLQSDFRNIQKFVKHMFCVVHYDLCSSTLAVGGRGTNMAANGIYGLIVETTNYIKLKCPELAGFRTSADPNPVPGNTSYPLTQRRAYPYFLKDWTLQGAVGATSLINDNAPNVPNTASV